MTWLREALTGIGGCSKIAHMAVDSGTLGRRVADARSRKGFTQTQLAGLADLDRSALAKVERGSRRVTAVELARIAQSLDVRVESFFVEAPPSIVDHRNTREPGTATPAIDVCLESIARDVEFVKEHDSSWVTPQLPLLNAPDSHEEAERMAESVRNLLELGDGPARELSQLVERLGLTTFALALPAGEADAAVVQLAHGGVAVVNGSLHPGRRRLALAHELGHYLCDDHYTVDWRLGDITDETSREARFDRFARALLLPVSGLQQYPDLATESPADLRPAAIRVGSEFRVDMSTLARRLVDLGMCTWSTAAVVRSFRTTKADIIEMDLLPHDELAPPFISRDFQQAVLRLYRAETISPARTIDLLRGGLEESDLPELPPLPANAIWSFT